MRILEQDTELTVPNMNGSIREILDYYHVPVEGIVLLNGEQTDLDTVITPEEHDEIEIEVRSTDIRVIKQVGEFADETIPYADGMTVAQALQMAMEQAGLNINTDELTCIDYGANPTISYPAGLRTERIKPGAELHLSTQDKYSNGECQL